MKINLNAIISTNKSRAGQIFSLSNLCPSQTINYLDPQEKPRPKQKQAEAPEDYEVK
jgi:hypothetical protein